MVRKHIQLFVVSDFSVINAFVRDFTTAPLKTRHPWLKLWLVNYNLLLAFLGEGSTMDPYPNLKSNPNLSFYHNLRSNPNPGLSSNFNNKLIPNPNPSLNLTLNPWSNLCSNLNRGPNFYSNPKPNSTLTLALTLTLKNLYCKMQW